MQPSAARARAVDFAVLGLLVAVAGVIVHFLNARGMFPGNNVGFMSGLLGDIVSTGAFGLALLLGGVAAVFGALSLRRARGEA